MRAFSFAAAVPAIASAPAAGEVVRSGETGFAVSHEVRVPLPPADAFAALVRIAGWWDGAHTYSGSAANMRLDGRAPGCFCETVPADGSSIEHGRVVYARPGHTLRVQAMLGPLQSEAGNGVIEWTFAPGEGGGTIVRQTYRVAGQAEGGIGRFATIVDQVMTGALDRYRASVTPAR